MPALSPEILALETQLVALRRELHQHFELAFQETKSARVVAAAPADPNHSSRIDFDEAALPVGEEFLIETAEEFFTQ